MRAMRLGMAIGVMVAAVGVGTVTTASAQPAPGTGEIVIIKKTTGGDGAFAFELKSAGGGTVATKAVATSAGTGTGTMADVPAGSYTLSEEVLPGWKFVSVDCGTGVNTDVPNQPVTVVAGETITCTYTNVAEISLTKVITSGPTLVAGHSDQFDIGYTLTMINTGATTREISVADVVDFGPGVAVISGPTLVSPPAALTVDTSWNATVTHLHVGDATLSIATTMILNFTVRVQLAPGTTTAARDCTRDAGEAGTGSLNFALVGVKKTDNERADGIVIASACAPLSTLTMQAQVVNDNGGSLTPSGITLTASGGATFSGTGSVQAAVGTAPVTMAGSAVSGYTASAFTCTGGTLAGAAVTVTPGADAVCTIVYDDNPPTTTTSTTTTVAATLPPTGVRTAKRSLAAGVLFVCLGGLLVLIGSVRRRRPA